jgi:hypothetical protein
LRTSVEGQEASELTGGIADGLAETLLTERAANGATERRTDLPQEVAEETLRHHLRTGVEWQELSELAGHSADRLTETLLTESAANDAAERRAELSQEVADSTLRHHLRTGVERQEASELASNVADRLAEALLTERATNGAAKRSAELSQEVANSTLRG